MKTSEQLDKFADALSKAQGKIHNPEKNKTATIPMKSGGKYSYSYADLPACYDAARESLSENGICHFSTIDVKTSTLTMRLLHASGQWIESDWLLPSQVDDKTLAGSVTYGKRYLFCALVGLAAEEDTDSEPEVGASYRDKVVKPVQAPQISQSSHPTLIQPLEIQPRAVSVSRERFLKAVKLPGIDMKNVQSYMKQQFKKESSKDLTDQECDELADWIEERAPESEFDRIARETPSPMDLK